MLRGLIHLVLEMLRLFDAFLRHMLWLLLGTFPLNTQINRSRSTTWTVRARSILLLNSFGCFFSLTATLHVDTLVLGEVYILDVILNLLELCCYVRHTIVIQNYLVELSEFPFLVISQILNLFIRQDLLQGVRDLGLNTNRDVLFHKVLDHSKVITVVLRFSPQLYKFFVESLYFVIYKLDLGLLLIEIVQFISVVFQLISMVEQSNLSLFF